MTLNFFPALQCLELVFKTIMVGTNVILIMQFGRQTSCQQEFEIETFHVTSWFLFLEMCAPRSAKVILAHFSSFRKRMRLNVGI